jgi:hypothetical protein
VLSCQIAYQSAKADMEREMEKIAAVEGDFYNRALMILSYSARLKDAVDRHSKALDDMHLLEVS